MKQKPPPGATLIARLKEGRLRREQELAERQQGKAAAETKSATTKAKPGSTKAAGEAAVVEAEVVSSKAKKKAPDSESFAPEVQIEAQVVEARQIPARTGGKERVDIIHREISINDLRPASDDYELLTEEIRLAGRFAAVGLIAQGMRLARLKDDDIYKHHYQTFEDYCRAEHTMSATYAYRLIRVAEMAERLGEEGHKAVGKMASHLHDAMPDPFEVMLGLGHRHLMALLPLEPGAAEDLLVRGVPVADESGKVNERIPIVKATEQQIRQALKILTPQAEDKAKPRKKTTSVPGAKSVRTLENVVDILSEWADWLETGPTAEAIADRIGTGREAKRLAQKLAKASQRVIASLESE